MRDEVLIVIPARMASVRLPGKPLADIGGKPMIVRVWERAVAADAGRVVVAAAEAEIADAIRAAGGEAVMTDPDLPSGSDRVWQAVERLGAAAQVIVNLQGDMPVIDSAVVRGTVAAMQGSGADILTLATRIEDEAELHNPNVVKIAMDEPGDGGGGEVVRALYFSRSVVPHGAGGHFHHVGIYVYRREVLQRFVGLPASGLERREKLEQLRALEAGMHIGVKLVTTLPLGVDTPEDLERARAFFAAGAS